MGLYRNFKTPSKFAQELLFFTDGLGHLRSEDFLIDREGFNNNLVMYVLSGKLHVEQNGHFVLSKNEGIIMRLMDKHKYYTDESDICEILWIHFNGRQAECFLKVIEQKHIMPAIFKESRVEELIRKCFILFQDNGSEREFLISEAIYSIILTIIHSVCKEDIMIKVDQQTVFMNKAISYVEGNIYNKITLCSFAGQFNFSQYHFCRVFEKHFHMPPMKYVLMEKIKISKYLLAYTHETISGIAGSLGFVDQSHFSKVFKSFENQSPLSFRKGRK